MKQTITKHDIGNFASSNFKKICLLIIISLSASSFASAQSQRYYWVGDTKHYFTVDSTELLIEVNSPDSKQAIDFKADTDVKFHRIKNTKTVQFGVKANARGNFINRNAIRAGQFVSYPMIRESGTNGKAFITDEITVKFDTEPDLKTFSSKHGIVLVEKLSYGAYLFKVLDRTKTLQVANRIKETERVVWSNPNFVHILQLLQATDPLYNNQYHLNNTGQGGGTTNIDVNAPEAWAITTGCNNIRVAVIDDGVEAHDDMAGRVLPGFTAGFNNTGGAPFAGAGHGEKCAGLIAASHNGLGGRGIAPNALIVPVNIFAGGSLTSAEIGAAINWAWRADGGNADILSNSWRASVASADVVNEIYNARLYGRGGRGAVVVFAAGNDGGAVNFPGNLNGVITVGAIDKSGNIWNYSSRGSEMDLVAPSGNTDNSGDVVTTDRPGTAGTNTASGAAGDYTNSFGGTSAACPQVAGVAALILSINPTLTEIDVRNILQYTATDMGTAGFDNTHGFGRVNAQAAVQAARISIAGTGTLCSSSTFTLTNIPIGAAGTWTVWPASLVATSNGTFTSLTGSATISIAPASGNPSGSVTLTVTTNTSCGTPISVTKTFWVGIPQLDGTFNGQLLAFSWVTPSDGSETVLYNDLCTSVMGNTNMIVGGSSGGSWTRISASPSNLSWSTSGKNISFYFYGNNQSSRFRFTASNSCGTTTKDYYFRSITCTPGGGGGCNQFTVSPNPAKSVVNIVVPHIPPPCNSSTSLSAESITTDEQKNDATIRSVRLIDIVDGSEKFSQKISGTKTFDLDVSKLKRGVYMLFVSDGKTTDQHRILVE